MQPQSLILITVDCFRADHAGFLGYERPVTPFLDCLAKEGIVFEQAIAAGAPTYYSVPAVLASRYPLALGRDVLGIAPEETTLASVLQESGFATAAFCAGNPYISSRSGFHQGFDVFEDFLNQGSPVEQKGAASSGFRGRVNRWVADKCHGAGVLGAAYDELYFQYCQRIAARQSVSFDSQRQFPSADVLVQHAIQWLQQNSNRRFFLWLHFMDAHGPYYPKPEALKKIGADHVTATDAAYLNSFWNRGDLSAKRFRPKRDAVVSLYDAGIRWVDEQIRRLSESLVDLNVWDRCALAVTADHGEEFLEHGGRYHVPRKLTEELVRVPMLLRSPGDTASRVGLPFSLIDLAPTLLDAVGLPSPAEFRGRSALAALRKGKLVARPVISEAVFGCTNPFYSSNRIGPRIMSVRLNEYKLVLDFSAGKEDLFDLARDPGEKSPLGIDEATDVRRKLMKDARKHVAESLQSRDFDRRIASQLRDFRLELARPPTRIQAN